MTTTCQIIVLACALSLLSACGNERQDSRRELFARFGEGLHQRLAERDDPKNLGAEEIRARVPALLKQVPAPMILVTKGKMDGADIFVLSTEVGDYRVFGSGNEATITLEGSVLSETRRLGDDLMSSQNGPLPELLARREEGDYQRVMRSLDGEGHEVAVMFDCRLSQTSVDRMIESCTTPGTAIKNIYEYKSDANLIARSEQWLSLRHGHLRIEHLRH